MILSYVIFSILIITAIFYCVVYFKFKKPVVMGLKIFTSFLFVLLGIVTAYLNKNPDTLYSQMIVLALVIGFLGDILLGLRGLYPNKKKVYFVLGLLMFFLGHMCYLSVFYNNNIKMIFAVLLALTGCIITAIFLEITHVDLQKVRILNYMYMLISAFLIVFTISNLINSYTVKNLLSFIGIINFVSSDFLLCYIYFKKMDPKTFKVVKSVNIITYYVAQGLLALSVFYM